MQLKRISVSGLCLLAGCNIFNLTDDDEKFLDENAVAGYDELIEIAYPYDIKIFPEGWQIVSFHSSDSDQIKDTIKFRTENSTAMCLIDWQSTLYFKEDNWTHIYTPTLEGLQEIRGRVFLFSRCNFGGKIVSAIHLFDTLSGTTAVVFADSGRNLHYLESDTASAYFRSWDGFERYRYDFETRKLETCPESVGGCDYGNVCHDGYFLDYSSDTVYKYDAVSRQLEWERVLEPAKEITIYTNTMMVHDEGIYLCGYQTAYYGVESMSYPRGTIIKMGLDGTSLWRYDSPARPGRGDCYYYGLAFTPQGDCWSIGVTRGGAYFYHDIVGIDANGTPFFQKVFSAKNQQGLFTNIGNNRILKVDNGIVHIAFYGVANEKYKYYYARIRY